MTEKEDSCVSDTSSNMEPKKMRHESSMNDAEHPLEIPVDEEENEVTSNNGQTQKIDSSSVSDMFSNTEPKKRRLESNMNDAEHPLEIPVDEEENEVTSINNQMESKKMTFACAVPKDGLLKDQIPTNISKRQQKRMLKQLRWEKWKPLKRAIERSKHKIKREQARLNNADLGPSRKALKRSTMANSTCKLRVVIDFSYDHLMSEREMRKACKQLARCYSLNRRAKNPMQFSVTNFTGKTKEDMQRNIGYENWDINYYEEGYLDVFKKDEIVYLSSESENVLTELDDSKVYIIGGLVDHNSHKNQSLTKANHQGIQHMQLPLLKYLNMKGRTILTIDHVFNILLLVTEGVSWKDAFLKILPPRKQAQPKSETSSEKSETSSGKSETSSGNSETSSGKSETSSENLETSSGKSEISSEKLETSEKSET